MACADEEAAGEQVVAERAQEFGSCVGAATSEGKASSSVSSSGFRFEAPVSAAAAVSDAPQSAKAAKRIAAFVASASRELGRVAFSARVFLRQRCVGLGPGRTSGGSEELRFNDVVAGVGGGGGGSGERSRSLRGRFAAVGLVAFSCVAAAGG